MRKLLAYVLLVYGPAGALVGVLHLGKALTPPPALTGTWWVDQHPIHVEQSGVFVRVQAGGTVHDARLTLGDAPSFQMDHGPCQGMSGVLHRVDDGWTVASGPNECGVPEQVIARRRTP